MSSTAPIFPDTEAMDLALGRVSLRRVFGSAAHPVQSQLILNLYRLGKRVNEQILRRKPPH